MLGFGTGILYGVQTADASGATVANATPVQFGTLQDISADISFEEKLLYGSYQMPIAVGRGKGKLAFKAKVAAFSGAILGDLFFGTGSSPGIKAVVKNFAASVPAVSTYTVTVVPPSSGTYGADLGVINASTGLPFKKVASGPTAGQYSVAGAVYTFAAADASAAVLISYEYTATSTSAKSNAFTNQLMGYAPSFRAVLSMSYQGKDLALALNNCVASKFSFPMKNDDFTVPEFEFSAFADSANNIGYWGTSD